MKSLKKIKTKHIILSISLLILLGSLGFYLVFKNNFSESSSSSSNYSQQDLIAPTPTPKLLPTGKQVFHFSHGSLVKGPKPVTATIDPIDPNMGDTQTFSIEINNDIPVSKATATLMTDNQETEYPLTLIEGDHNKGTWTVEWKMEDSYDYVYQVNLIIYDSTEVYNESLAFR